MGSGSTCDEVVHVEKIMAITWDASGFHTWRRTIRNVYNSIIGSITQPLVTAMKSNSSSQSATKSHRGFLLVRSQNAGHCKASERRAEK